MAVIYLQALREEKVNIQRSDEIRQTLRIRI